MIGYKNTDNNLQCRGFQFEVGKIYEIEGELSLCYNGFHFHKNPFDLFSFYDFNNSLVIEIEALGEILEEDNKAVTNKIKIIRVIERDSNEFRKLGNLQNNIGWGNTGDRNTGYRNTGYRNTGDRNTGYRNTGDWNTGDRNTGDCNTGDWNTGNQNTGYFNTETPQNILVFNKPCSKDLWDQAEKPAFIYFDLSKWIYFSNMSEEERSNHPNAETVGGYLKVLEYKEAWKLAYESASKYDIELLKALPNFDAEIFEQISGIKID